MPRQCHLRIQELAKAPGTEIKDREKISSTVVQVRLSLALIVYMKYSKGLSQLVLKFAESDY